MKSLKDIEGALIVGAPLVVTMGHQVLLVRGSFKLMSEYSFSVKEIILIYLIAVPLKDYDEVSPDDFQSIRAVST
jgi:hypothetical protein